MKPNKVGCGFSHALRLLQGRSCPDYKNITMLKIILTIVIWEVIKNIIVKTWYKIQNKK
jgi:hypothetical protein